MHRAIRVWTGLVLLGCFLSVASQAQTAGTYHYMYVDSGQHIEHLTRLGSTYGTWQDITSINGGPATALNSSQIAGFADSLGDHVFYIGANQHVYQLYYAFSSRAWLGAADLTATIGGPLAWQLGYLSAFSDSVGEHLIYVGCSPSQSSCASQDYHVYQLFYSFGTRTWGNSDLATATGGVTAWPYTFLTSFADSLGEHIYFQGTNFHIYQLYYAFSTRSWQPVDDLTATTDGVVPEQVSQLTSFADGTGEHVIWEDTSFNLHQLFYSLSSRSWSDQNLSSAAGLLPGSLCEGSPLASIASGSYEFIAYSTSTCNSPLGAGTGLIWYNGARWSNQGMPENDTVYFASAGRANLHNDFLYYAYDPDISGNPPEMTTVSVGPTGVTADAFIQPCCGVGQPAGLSSSVLAFIDP